MMSENDCSLLKQECL